MAVGLAWKGNASKFWGIFEIYMLMLHSWYNLLLKFIYVHTEDLFISIYVHFILILIRT